MSFENSNAITEPLRNSLLRLDKLLSQAVESAHQVFINPIEKTYRGLCITEEEVEKLLLRQPMRPTLWMNSDYELSEAQNLYGVCELQERFGLSGFDMDVILMALAVEIDLKYERLFAYLNDDLTKKWPTVDLAFNILCESDTEKLTRYNDLSSTSRLYSFGILQRNQIHDNDSSLLSRRIKLDPIVLRYYFGDLNLDNRLKRFCMKISPIWETSNLPLEQHTISKLLRTIDHIIKDDDICLYFNGPSGCGQEECAEAIAGTFDTQLLSADFNQISTQEHTDMLRLVLLYTRLNRLILFVKGNICLTDKENKDLLEEYNGPILFDYLPTRHTITKSTVCINLYRPNYSQRYTYWSHLLKQNRLESNKIDIDYLAALFELDFPHIKATLTNAQQSTGFNAGLLSTENLSQSARKHSSHALAEKAVLLEPVHQWTDLILPEDAKVQIKELCDRVRRRQRVLQEWGFGREHRGTGVNALFVGGSGTGKTLAAEVIAAELGLNLYRIDLAAVVSKYIGETEKNLDTIFNGAEQSNAVLLFDEADALFGKRSAVRDAHDRYANVEVAYLLQRLESYPGVSILTTNLSDNLDQAFIRRLAYTVHFPFPGIAEREKMWQRVWPPRAPLSTDIQPRWLAERFKLSGGNIRNIALTAACLVEDENESITMSHILHALRREYHKMGKAIIQNEFELPETDIKVASV